MFSIQSYIQFKSRGLLQQFSFAETSKKQYFLLFLGDNSLRLNVQQRNLDSSRESSSSPSSRERIKLSWFEPRRNIKISKLSITVNEQFSDVIHILTYDGYFFSIPVVCLHMEQFLNLWKSLIREEDFLSFFQRERSSKQNNIFKIASVYNDLNIFQIGLSLVHKRHNYSNLIDLSVDEEESQEKLSLFQQTLASSKFSDFVIWRDENSSQSTGAIITSRMGHLIFLSFIEEKIVSKKKIYTNH